MLHTVVAYTYLHMHYNDLLKLNNGKACKISVFEGTSS